jgi:hypoxia up-regulated 1
MKSLLGKAFDDPAVKSFNSSLNLIPSSLGTVAFQLEDTSKWELEEIVAMLLAHAKKQAENYSGIKVSGAVITVPPHFTVFERKALLDAAEIANLRVFGLINDETAGMMH